MVECSSDLPIRIKHEYDKHVESLSTGAIVPPTAVIDLLLSDPSNVPLAFALQTAESLLVCYTYVDHFLDTIEGGWERLGAEEKLLSAAREIGTCWTALLRREDVDERVRQELMEKLVPEQKKIFSKCGEEFFANNPDRLDLIDDRCLDPFAYLPRLCPTASTRLEPTNLTKGISPQVDRYLARASATSSRSTLPLLASSLLGLIQGAKPQGALNAIEKIQIFLCERVDVHSMETAGLKVEEQETLRESVARVVMQLERVLDGMSGIESAKVATRMSERKQWTATLLGLCWKWEAVMKRLKHDCWSTHGQTMRMGEGDERSLKVSPC
jgi:hypothetical protein